MSSVPASRVRALTLVVLLLPFAAIASLPTASAWWYWKEDWESGTDGWTLAGSFAKQDCSTRFEGSCSLKLDPPCAPGTLASSARTDYPNRGGNGIALSFAMRPGAMGGDTRVWVDVDLQDYWGGDPGGLTANIGWGDGLNVQLFSEGRGASNMPNIPSVSGGWYIVSLRVESYDNTAWVDVFNSAGAKLVSTSKVGVPPNSEPSTVQFSAASPIELNDPTCTARAFWFDTVRLGDSLPTYPSFPAATATRSSVGLSWTAASDPGTVPITSYRVWRSLNGGPETEVGSTGATATSYTDNNLQNGATYTYRVRARNAYGDGAFSEPIQAVTWGFTEAWESGTAGWTASPSGVTTDCAGAVSGCGIALLPSGGAAEVSHVFNQAMTGRFQASFWYNATPNASATDARFTASFEGPTWQGSAATLHLTDGPGGLGLRVESGSSSATVPFTVAADTWMRVALVVEAQSDVAWAEVRDADDNVVAVSTTVPIPSTVSVVKSIAFASSSSGAGPTRVRVDELRTGYLPGAPTNLDGAAAFRTATLTWVRPTELGSGTLTGYRVYRAPLGGASQPIATVGAGVTSFSDSGLGDDASYEYTVSTITTSGLGPRSAGKVVRTDRVSEGFESGLGSWNVSDPASAFVSCSAAHSGSCGLRVNPATRGVTASATRTLDSPVAGSFTASAWVRTDRAPAATDATFRLSFANGKSIEVDFLRAGATSTDAWRIRLDSGGYYALAPGLSASSWHQVLLFVVPDGSHVKAEIRGADGRVISTSDPYYFPSGYWTGGNLTSVGVHVKHAASGSTAVLDVDDVRVHETLTSRPSIHTWKGAASVGLRWWGHSSSTAVTGFRVYAGPQGGAMQKVAEPGPTADEYVVRNLADGSALVNGQRYCVVVSVLTAYGESPTSWRDCQTPQAVPDAPPNLRATSGANKVTLAWDAPGYPGDPAATQYCIDRRTPTHTQTPVEIACVPYSQRSYVDSTAVGGVKYYYTVRAKNTAGSSLDSNMVLGQPTLT